MTETSPQRVLIIDDSQDIHDLIAVRLRSEGVVLQHAYDAETAFDMASQQQPDLLLLDLDLPGISGLEFCRRLKHEPSLISTAVIFLTGTVDVATKVQAFDAGAVDYITKPFDGIELRARVRAALRTKRYLDLLSTRAQLDGLTGLWNRAYFDQRLSEEVALAQRHGRPLSLILLDVDHFKQVNDQYGHPFGDQVLCSLAQVLNSSTRQTEIACRYGGEEFIVILRETGLAGGQEVAERIRAAVEALQFTSRGKPVQVTASLGLSADSSLGPDWDAEKLLSAADQALYQAKALGRNRVMVAN
ncbi:MAG: diguanylate cyclase response regulator [Candidatus Melainabacteria bacterium HGW-Melainabacteria-1]|nr:MAG: diguanylate cyclase response regulator [Candidatus Melainabacteria bacterium HGW-Melainabacteria-1]